MINKNYHIQRKYCNFICIFNEQHDPALMEGDTPLLVIFIKKHNKRDIQCQTTQNCSRARLARVFVVILAFINLNIDFGRSKTTNSNKQTHQR